MNFKLSQKAVTSIHVKYSKKIQELKAAFQTSEVAEKAKEVYKGDAIKGW